MLVGGIYYRRAKAAKRWSFNKDNIETRTEENIEVNLWRNCHRSYDKGQVRYSFAYSRVVLSSFMQKMYFNDNNVA
jgi:hypothetical protein